MSHEFSGRFIKEGCEVVEEEVAGMVMGSKDFECTVLLRTTIVSFDDRPKTGE